MNEVWINLYYAACFAVSVVSASMVMWKRIPTGISGTVGFTLIALVTAGIATDWLDANLPWIGVKRGLILWAGLLFVVYWAFQKPWAAYERRRLRPLHRRHEESDIFPTDDASVPVDDATSHRVR